MRGADASFYVRPPRVKDRTSAGGVVVRREGAGYDVALVTLAGMADYILPKGGVEKGETLEEAARREIREEAGFRDIALLAPLGSRQRLSFDRRKWITTHYFLFETTETDPQPTDPHVPYRTDWFALADPDAWPPLLWPEQRELLDEVRRRLNHNTGGSPTR